MKEQIITMYNMLLDEKFTLNSQRLNEEKRERLYHIQVELMAWDKLRNEICTPIQEEIELTVGNYDNRRYKIQSGII